MLVMYSALLRQSEVVNLRRADVSFTVEGAGSAQTQTAVLWVKVSHAKNDQRGLKPPRPCPALGDREMCVCSAMRAYLARAVHTSGDAHLFYNTIPSAGRAALASTTPSSILRGRLKEAKVPDWSSPRTRPLRFGRGRVRCARCVT